MMKKTVLLTALIAMSTSTPALANQWKHLGTDGARNHYFYNPRTFNVDKNAFVSSWTKKEYNVDPDVMAREKLAPDMFKGSKTVSAFEEFDCGFKKKRVLVGKSVEGVMDSKDLKRTGWLDVAPGSMDESLLNALCREGEKKMKNAK